MNDEIPSTEIPGSQVPPQDQTPANVPAPPPAAALVAQGEVTDERALALARREAALADSENRRRAEENALAERERKIQERESALAGATPPKQAKVKRKPGWSDPVFGSGEDEL